MKTLFWILAIFALAVGLTLAAKYNTGYVLLVYPPYRAELSLNLLTVLLLAIFAIGYAILRLAIHTLRLPSYVREFKLERRRSKAHAAMAEAYLASAEGRYAKAEKLASSALDMGEAPALNALLAARAAHEIKAYARRDDYLLRAERLAPDFPVARLMTQVELLLDQRRATEALAALKYLRELAPRHTGVLRLELKAQQLAKNWEQLPALISQLEKRDAIEPVHAEQLKINAHLEIMKRKAFDAAALKAYWLKIASPDKVNSKIALGAARLFLTLNEVQSACGIIERSLERQWDSELIALYGTCFDKEVIKQIERAENWLKAHPGDAALLLALGRLCAHQELWGKAQSYLEASLAVEQTRQAHIALAQLLEKMNRSDEACRHYRQSSAMLEEQQG